MDISHFTKPSSFSEAGKDLINLNVLDGLTESEIVAIRSFNTQEKLLESVMTKLQNKLAEKWLKSNPEHFKQRDWYFTLSQSLGDVSKIIAQCSQITKD